MSYEIDPSFRNSGARARSRARRRIALRLAAGLTGVGLIGAILLAVWSFVADGVDPRVEATGLVRGDAMDDFAMIQTDVTDAPQRVRTTAASFLNLRRDPMILRFEQTGDSKVTRIAGPAGFVADRGGGGAERLSMLRDALFVAERRLITTLPSSRDDFALFQAQRSQVIGDAAGVAMVPANRRAAPPVAAGLTVRVEEEGSWGSFISDDATSEKAGAGDVGTGDAGTGSVTEAAVYVETRIANTTSIAVTQPEDQRLALFEDVIVVLRTDRELTEVLQSNGFPPIEAQRIADAAARLIGVGGALAQGGIVALRLRTEPGGGRSLMQMSLYGPQGYVASLAQVGAGRFAAAADPWLADDLLGRSGALRHEALSAQDVRLLDALYSSAIRNGLATNLVGEMIVIMSQRFDLDRFVAQGDAVTILFATEPGPDGPGAPQILYVGIDGSSDTMTCYVTRNDSASGFGCYDFDAMEQGGRSAGLGGGLLVPVNGVRTSGFGPRHHPILRQVRNHNGVDWAAPTGTPIRAAMAGRISFAGVAGGYGNVVYIDHGGGAETRYAHLNGFSDKGRAGGQVAQGDIIGFVGTTGRSTGPHLHFELRVGGEPVNPLSFVGLSGGGAPGSQAVDALVNQIIRVESAGNARAQNPLSTATGLGQFIESTWLRMLRDYRPDLARTMARGEQLQLRFDPALSREMVRNLARENEGFLRARGHQITAGRLYLAHFLGPGGANTALSSDPQASVLDIMGAQVVNANPFLRGKNIADLHAWSDRKMRGTGAVPVVGVTTPVRATIPPEVTAFRQQVDQLLGE